MIEHRTTEALRSTSGTGLSRRGFLRLGGAAATTIGLAACAGPPATPGAGAGPVSMTAVQTSAGPTFPWIANFVAIGAGFFAEEGIELDYQYNAQGSGSAIAAVVGRSALVGFTGSTTPFTTAAQGGPVRVIGCESNQLGLRCTAATEFLRSKGTAAADPLEQRLAALRGATIGMSQAGDSTDQMIRFVLPRYGVPIEAITLRPLGSAANMLSALEQGQIDAMVTGAGNEAPAVESGAGEVLVDTSEIPALAGYPTLAISANLADLGDDGKVATMGAALRAITRGMRLVREDPGTAKAHARSFFASVPDAAYDQGFEIAQATLADSVIVTPAAFEVYAAVAGTVGGPVPAFEQAVDLRPAEEALAALGSS